MSTTSSIKLLDNPVALSDTWKIAKATNEVIAQGDLIEENGSGAEVVDGADNTIFCGVALEGRAATDARPLAVAFRCVIKGKMASGQSVTKGNAVAYAAGGNGTTWTFNAATAEGIGWALETISAGETGRILIDVPALQAATIFETVTT